MRLVKLELTDFLNHESTVVEFGRITLFAGDNNVGKTAIIDALEMALTGSARYTDKAGKNAAPVVRAGRASFWVSVEIEVPRCELIDDGSLPEGDPVRFVISRSKGTTGGHSLDITPVGGQAWQGGPQRLQEALYRTLGLTQETIRACLHAWKLPRLKPEEQEALVLDYLDLKIDLGEIEKFAQAAGATPEDCKLLYHGPRGAFLAAHPVDAGAKFSPEIFDEADSWIREQRRQAKRDLGSARAAHEASAGRVDDLLKEVPSLADTDEGSLPRMKGQMDELQARRDELNRDLGKTAVKGTEGLIPEKIQADIEGLEKKLAARVEWEKRRDEVTGHGDLKGQIETCERTIEDHDAQVRDANTEVHELEVAIDNLSEGNVCPIINEECDRLEEHRAKTLKSFKGKLTRRTKKRDALGDVAEMRVTLGDLVAVRDSEPEGDQTSDELVSAIEIRRKQLAELADVPDKSEVEAELAALVERIDRGQSKIRKVQTYQAALKARADNLLTVQELEVQVDAWERLVKAFSPAGAKLKAVDEPLEKLEEALNGRIQELAPRHELSLRSEGGFEILTRTPGTGSEWISLKGVSMSEALRIGIAIAAILADLSGFRVLVVDNFEWLVGKAKDELAAALHEWCMGSQILESVVIFKSTDTRPTASPARATYWIEDGKAEVVA